MLLRLYLEILLKHRLQVSESGMGPDLQFCFQVMLPLLIDRPHFEQKTNLALAHLGTCFPHPPMSLTLIITFSPLLGGSLVLHPNGVVLLVCHMCPSLSEPQSNWNFVSNLVLGFCWLSAPIPGFGSEQRLKTREVHF